MSGRYSGSKTTGDRRRRRIAADETQPAAESAEKAGDSRPLPERRPTGRFPLRRLISPSPWKLAAAGVFMTAVCGGAVAFGYVPPIRSGNYGPGLTALCDAETGRLPSVVGGLLLLATGQLAWLIRWARARSLRDFRGGYRIWWWTSLALLVAGITVLSDAQIALGSTIVWLAGPAPFGSDMTYRVLPASAALLILLPSLQRDMRGCRTSRFLILAAALLWVCGSTAAVEEDRLSAAVARLGLNVPPTVIDVSLLLAGTATAFTSLLFHARHVVYESVEPPPQPVRRKKVAVAAGEEAAEVREPGEEAGKKPKRAAARRASRSKSDEATEEAIPPEPASSKAKTESKVTPAVEAPSAPSRPHFLLKEQVLKTPKLDAVPAKVEKSEPVSIRPEPVVAKPQSKPEPPRAEPKLVQAPAKSSPPVPEIEDDEDCEDMAEIGGRKVRLDGAEDPLRGLSKRERRKLRKEMKHRDLAER